MRQMTLVRFPSGEFFFYFGVSQHFSPTRVAASSLSPAARPSNDSHLLSSSGLRMPALRPDVLAKALGRDPLPGLIGSTEPHERGFGTSSRFASATSTLTPGPFTNYQELQLVTGLQTLIVKRQTKAQCFDTTNKRFLMNDAILAARQNLPDPETPGPSAYSVKSQFDLSDRRGVIRRPSSRTAMARPSTASLPEIQPTRRINKVNKCVASWSPPREASTHTPRLLPVLTSPPRAHRRPFRTPFEQLM